MPVVYTIQSVAAGTVQDEEKESSGNNLHLNAIHNVSHNPFLPSNNPTGKQAREAPIATSISDHYHYRIIPLCYH